MFDSEIGSAQISGTNQGFPPIDKVETQKIVGETRGSKWQFIPSGKLTSLMERISNFFTNLFRPKAPKEIVIHHLGGTTVASMM